MTGVLPRAPYRRIRQTRGAGRVRAIARIGAHSHTLDDDFNSGSIPFVVCKGKIEYALRAIPTDTKRWKSSDDVLGDGWAIETCRASKT